MNYEKKKETRRVRMESVELGVTYQFASVYYEWDIRAYGVIERAQIAHGCFIRIIIDVE